METSALFFQSVHPFAATFMRCAVQTALLGSALIIPPSLRGDEVLHLDIARSGSNVVITWTNGGAVLESALSVTGAWTEVQGAFGSQFIPATNFTSFFRLRENLPPPAELAIRYIAPSFTTSIGDPVGCGCTSPENPNSLSAGGNSQDNGMGSVLLHTGELTQDVMDLEIPGRGFNWRFERRYRSGMDYDGPLGHGWDFSLNRRLTVETNGNMLRMDGMGRADRYMLNTNGTFDSPSGFYTQLKQNLDGTFEERERHGSTNSYSATNTQGIARLTRISDRNGNRMTLQYNSVGQLTAVVDTLNRSIAYRYDAHGRLTNVVDFTGRALTFTYDVNGNLVSAKSPAVTGTPNANDFPTGKTVLYSYASGFGDARFNHNLLSVTAPNEAAVSGPPRLNAQYDNNPASPNADRLLSLQLGGVNNGGIGAGGIIYYSYASLGSAGSNDFASPVFQTNVTNRNGNVTEYRYNQLGNMVRTVQFTRGVRPGDPAAYTNTFTYNKDGELIARTNSELDSAQIIFDFDNPDRFQQGNVLQTIRLPGPRGGDQAQIVTAMTYEPIFNFVRTNIDARSNVTVYSYDDRGNRTNVIHRIPSIVEDFEYNAYGQMTAHTLPDNGNGHRRRDETTYYASGPQTGYPQGRIVDSGGFNLTITYQYDALGNLVRMVDARGNDTLLIVNQLNQPVRELSRPVSTPSGSVRYQIDTFYDANNNVTRRDIQNRDDTGAVVSANPSFTASFSYDILDGQLSMTQELDTASSIVTAYAYDANQNRILTRSGEATSGRQPNNVVVTAYDERDLVLGETRAPGSPEQSTTQQDYDGNGNMVRTLQGTEDVPGVRITTVAYEGYNRRLTSADPMGNISSYHYDANCNMVSNRVDGELTDVAGGAGNVRLSETAYTYDEMDRRVRADIAFFTTQTGTPIGDGLATTLMIYSPNSQILAVIDDNNHGRTNSYDTANRVSQKTDAKGNSVIYSYDPNGNIIATTNTDKSDLGSPNQLFSTVIVYDGLDRVSSANDNVGNTAQYRYDSRNNPTLLTDPRGNLTRYTYDGLNRLIQTSCDMNTNGIFSDAVDVITTQTWDDSSRLIAQTDDNGNATRYGYDALNRLIVTQMGDGTLRQIGSNAIWNLGDPRPDLSGFGSGYDVHGNPVTSLDANGTRVDSGYDLNDRLVTNHVTLAAGVLGTTTEFYQHDGLSRLVLAQDDDSTVTRNYDSLSRVVGEMQTLTGVPTRTVGAQYDGVGNQQGLFYPSGRGIFRAYDSLNRPLLVQQAAPAPPTNIATYKYIGPSRVERRDYGNGTRTSWQYDGVTGVPNSANDFGLQRIARTTHTNTTSSGLIDDRTYAWDRNGNNTNGVHRMDL